MDFSFVGLIILSIVMIGVGLFIAIQEYKGYRETILENK